MRLLINKIIITIGLILCFTIVKAHNPNTTSVVFSPINGVWTVHLAISQQGANYALENYYSHLDLQNQSMNEFKELYIDYVKNHIHLQIDGKEIPMGSGGIKFGKHQSDIRFLLPSFPEEYKTVELNLTVFKENINQNTVVRFIQDEYKFRKVLNSKNGFLFTFENTPKGFIGKKDKKKIRFFYFLIPAFSVLVVILTVLKRRKTAVNKSY